jgi:hypothetical protein
MLAPLAAPPCGARLKVSIKEDTVQLTFDIDITQGPVELDRREGDGVVVSLLWRRDGNVVSVAVSDERSGEDFELVVEPERALDAFHHPYAYAAGRGLLSEPDTREPVYA